MNKRVKGILAGCGVLAVLGGGLTFLLLTGGDGEESSVPQEENTAVELWAYDSDAVSRVEVNQPHGDTYAVNRRVDQTDTTDINGAATVQNVNNYFLEGYESLPMSTVSIRLLATRASDVHAEQTVLENAAASDLATYGLDDPIRVRLTLDNADDIAFCIGNATPVSGYTYVCMEGGSTVYTVATSNIEPYLSSITDYLGTTLIPEQADDDERIVMSARVERTNLDYDMYFVFDPYYEINSNSGTSAVHVMQEPIYCLLSPDKSADTTHGLFGLTASEVLLPFPTAEQMTDAGLDEPFVRVTLVLSDGEEMVFRLGNTYTTEDGETRYYGMADGLDCIYGFSAEDTVYDDVLPNDVTSKVVVDLYVWDIGTIKYETDTVKLDFTVLGESADDVVLTLNGARYDNVERYRLLYTYLLKTAAEDLIIETPDDVGEEMASVYIERQDGQRNYDIRFYDAGGLKAYIEIDGQIRFRCRKSYVTTLISNMEKFADEDQDFIMTW